MTDVNEIDHLSYSSIKKFLECPRSWATQYLDEVPSRKGFALIRGTVVDRIATENWNRQAARGVGLSLEEAQDIGEGLYRKETEQELDWGTYDFGSGLDSTQKLIERHLVDHAPLYKPFATQQRVEREIPGSSRIVIGYLDAVTDDRVLDVKTGSRKMSRGDEQLDLQATAYAWLIGEPIQLDFLRVIDTGKNVSSEIVRTVRGPHALTWFEDLVTSVSGAIDTGYYPTSPGFHCNWCPIRQNCTGDLTFIPGVGWNVTKEESEN